MDNRKQNQHPNRPDHLPLYTGYLIWRREEHKMAWEFFLRLIDVACWCAFYHIPSTHCAKALANETAFAELADLLLLLPQKELQEE